MTARPCVGLGSSPRPSSRSSRAALRLKPDTGVWWLGLAISLQAAHRSPEAQDAYRRAKSTNNLNPELAAFADQRLRQLQ